MILVVAVAILHVASPALAIPSPTYAAPCRRHTDNFNACVKRALQLIIPKIGKRGITELDIETIDPLYVPEMVFNYDTLPDIGGKMVVRETTAAGLSTLEVTGVRSRIVEGKSFGMDVDFCIPKMELIGRFVMNGRVGLFPVTGNGPYNVTTGEIRGTWKLRGTPVIVEGVEYLHLHNFGMRPTVGYFKFHADNLVKGNPQLSTMVVAFTNRFWNLLHNQSLPYFEKNFDILGREILNKLFSKVPYNHLFPKD